MMDNKFTQGAKMYFDSIRNIHNNPDFQQLRQEVYDEMDTYYAEHPEMSKVELKAVLYETIARKATPRLLPCCPFYSELGVKKIYGLEDDSIALWGADIECREVAWTGPMMEYSYPNGSIEREPGYVGIAFGPVFDPDHHCPGYAKVFEKGIDGIIAEAEAIMQTEPEGSEKYIFNASVARGLKAINRISAKFADEARKQLLTAEDPEERKYLQMIADTADRVPANPPKTFYEGLATLLFIYETMEAVDGISMSVLGRVDLLLGKLYENDIRSGRMTAEEAMDLIEKWICLPDLRCNARDYHWPDISCVIELGGCDEDGAPVYNEVTKLMLQTHTRLHLINPKLNCRIGSNSPQEYLEVIAQSLLHGDNTIALLNDDVLIPGLVSSGRELCDARGYVNGGCQETIVGGCEHSAGAVFYFNLSRVLDLSMNADDTEGFFQQTIDALPAVIEKADTFEEFYDQYFENMTKALQYAVDIRLPYGKRWAASHPSLFFSSTLKNCMENGKDYAVGGAKYNFSTIGAYGFATLADSLFAIKKAVFEDKIITLQELKNALLSNWVGYEKLQKQMKNYPKFGHAHQEADAFAGKVFQDINRFSLTMKNERDGSYIFSTFTHTNFHYGAPYVRATADGRHDGEVLSQSVSPSRQQYTKSLTEAITSLQALDLKNCGGICILDAMLPCDTHMTPSLLANLFRAFTLSGGQTLQPNYVTLEDLLDAKVHPENHTNLTVRVCGFSAYFINLQDDLQDDIIARNRYEAC